MESSDMKKTLFAISVLYFNSTIFAGAPSRIELHMHKDITLSKTSQQQLQVLTLQLLKYSNFNSVTHNTILKKTIPEIQRLYRATVKNRYLIISFNAPKMINTSGGPVSTYEIVVGMGKQYANALFTIDSTGRIVQHEKYPGHIAIKLLKLVEKIANLSKNKGEQTPL